MSSAVVKARLSGTTSPVLLLGTTPGLSGAIEVPGVLVADSVYEFPLTGLAPFTDYHYGVRGSSTRGRLKTLPTPGAPTSFTLAAASCAGSPVGADDYPGPGNTSNSPAWEAIAARRPLLYINLGDWGYPDIDVHDVTLYRQNFRDNAANARQRALWLTVPYIYAPSDHDYADDDSDKTAVSRGAFWQAYREYVPHAAMPDVGAVYQNLPIGRTQLHMLDIHSERSPNSDPDGPAKTMLGTLQKAWLFSSLLASTASVHIIAINAPWISTGAAWPNYGTEQQEIAEFLEDNGLTDRTILLHGDHHFVCADDGTNSQMDPGSVNPGPLVVGLAPIDQSFTGSTGTYSEGIHKVSKQQYGTIKVTDTGGPTLDVDISAWAVASNASETEIPLLSKSFAA